ncbi:DUF4251 domain-containing protein [Flammeovirga pectinis]|uniref:DUF4251 domain-containing protein n=1 Tax=Flammeovirga pectinis TaxID=2494373 RepID=A0A3Q9FRJ3_9BACT|nr:DUF4251 domain-containing protein [Flammeovirga pectinis]AZQ62860.1 DUF4251 domain-containing protein [Flammeovirga pectinis]
MKNIQSINRILGLLFLLTISFGVGNSFAQDTATKKETKAEKKAAKKAAKEKKKEARLEEEQVEHAQNIAAINNKTYTLEANQAFDRRGNMVNVDPSINFVKVTGDRAVVQLSFTQLVGFNGVGGVTVDGNISDYKVTTNPKNQMTRVTFHVQGPTMMADVSIELEADGSWANSSVEGDFSAAELKFRGELKPNSLSSSYEGTTRY